MLNLTDSSSQTCEKLFRAARSMPSTFSTVINFSIKDLMHRIDRIGAINSIKNDLCEIFSFPGDEKKGLGKTMARYNESDFLEINIEKTVLGL